MKRIEQFFAEIDWKWPSQQEGPIKLLLIGSGALMLQADYARGTKDSDVFETSSLTREIQTTLLSLAGPGTDLHARHRLYVEVVPNGLPFLPRQPVWVPLTELNASLGVLSLHALDVVDVVVSKLKRFSANDQTDINAMIELELVAHERLLDRFRSAFEELTYDARAADLPQVVENLNQVERDMLGVSETEFDLSDLKY